MFVGENSRFAKGSSSVSTEDFSQVLGMSAANADTAKSAAARVFIVVTQDIRQRESNETRKRQPETTPRNGSSARCSGEFRRYILIT